MLGEFDGVSRAELEAQSSPYEMEIYALRNGTKKGATDFLVSRILGAGGKCDDHNGSQGKLAQFAAHVTDCDHDYILTAINRIKYKRNE